MTRASAVVSVLSLLSGATLAIACRGPVSPSNDGGMNPGAQTQPCPTTGLGGVISVGACWVFSPASAGASPGGQNASRLNYALEPPSGAARGTLVVLLNGSGSFPAQLTIDPSRNLFASALETGNHVLAVAYRSDVAIAQMCDSTRPNCYGASRNTLVTGAFSPGADNSLADIRADEGIIARVDQALRHLVTVRPQGGWDAFIRSTASAPADRIVWQRVIAAGHSQGGGHAAYLGKLFSLIRVVQLSSTCDAPAGVPAPWTSASSDWSTSPATAFFGLSAPTIFTNGIPTAGDLNCPYHLAVWQNLGMPASHQDDDAATCAGIDPHAVSILCGANYPRWVALFR